MSSGIRLTQMLKVSMNRIKTSPPKTLKLKDPTLVAESYPFVAKLHDVREN